ncbi:MAG: hypothetical protein NE334_19630 [Lentisphaeraceae bacterium]|nr:hypothetical protein [Lentisphaeraceae bacterium]
MDSIKLHTSLTEDEHLELSRLLKESNFEGKSVMIATPCYGGQLSEAYMRGILDVSLIMHEKKIPFYVFTIANESLITRARNSTVAQFLGSPEYSHLLFIDADIEFSPLEFFRLLASDKEVVGGCYPGKSINWQKIHDQVTSGASVEELEARSLNYMVNYHLVETEQGSALNIENDFVEVNNLATGFLMIRRSVFEKLIESRPQDKYVNDIAGYNSEKTKDKFYLFFDTMCDESGRYLSEDYAFCTKWREVGGQVWMDIQSKLTHTGFYKFKGDLLPYLKNELGG